MTRESDWVVCQLGAREHYAIPRALHAMGCLDMLLTDAWVPPGSPLGMIRRNLRERHHPAIPGERVNGFTAGAIGFEAAARLRGWQGWEGILRRNDWFQQRVVDQLCSLNPGSAHLPPLGTSGKARRAIPTLFSFSYTAREPFRWAKRKGWKTVLGQIDGALGEERHIAEVQQRHEAVAGAFRPAPPRYWEQWREECEMADTILVNSEWSRSLLMREGIPSDKIETVPLAYSPPTESLGFVREYPAVFDRARPLRVLFLGQVSVRKGVMELLEAARMLAGRPVEWWMVGPEVVSLPRALREQGQVRWFGAVPRGKAAEFYRNADVFLFPTHSDGFGLTQLEAQAWKLPIIASAHCGRVVQPGRNGLELDAVSAEAIAEAIESCLEEPERLAGWSRQAVDLEAFSLDRLASRLSSL